MKTTTSTTDLKPDDISFTLDITLDIPPAPMSSFLVNLQADKNAKLLDIKATFVTRFDHRRQEHIEYSAEQQNTLIIYDKDSIEFKGRKGLKKTYHFPSNRVSMKQFIDAIVDFEKFDRPTYQWSGGIDCHHIFYEGCSNDGAEDGAYFISWGS